MERMPRFNFDFGKRRWLIRVLVVVLAVAIILAVLLPTTILRTVGVGYAAVLVDPLAGTITGPIIGPALFFKAPWVTDIHIYYAIDSIGMWKENGLIGDFPPISPISKDGLRIEVDLLVRWSIDPTKLVELYTRFPNVDWKDRVISSVVRESGRDVVGQYTAIQIIENRSLLTQDLSTQIVAAMQAEDSLVDSTLNIEVDLRDIDPPLDFITAIEEKLAAEQGTLQAEFERQKILILANASAAEKIIAAEGEAMSRLIVANGTAEAIQIIADQTGANSTELTNLFLTLEALKEIGRTTENFIVILGQDGLTYLIPVEPTNP